MDKKFQKRFEKKNLSLASLGLVRPRIQKCIVEPS
jgi:hypothetical protein